VVLVAAGAKVSRWFDRNPFIYRGPLGTRRSLSVMDVRRLESWHDAALTAATLAEVFADA
jgi:hypothetical protein